MKTNSVKKLTNVSFLICVIFGISPYVWMLSNGGIGSGISNFSAIFMFNLIVFVAISSLAGFYIYAMFNRLEHYAIYIEKSPSSN